MKKLKNFIVRSLVTGPIVMAVIIAGAALAAAQTDSAASAAQTRYPARNNSPEASGCYIYDPGEFRWSKWGQPRSSAHSGPRRKPQWDDSERRSQWPWRAVQNDSAGALTSLYSFCPETGCVDGSGPRTLMLGTDGNFYGDAANGGASGGYGVVFKFKGRGAPTTLHSFDGTDGAYPLDRLVQVGGNFYGTTPNGGDLGECNGVGCGTAFKITPTGTINTLHDFCSQPDCADGAVLYDSLVRAPTKPLRGNLGRRSEQRRHGLQYDAEGEADDTLQLLRSKLSLCTTAAILSGSCSAPTETFTGNRLWWGRLRRGNGLQNHSKRDADYDLQLLRPDRMYRRLQPSQRNKPRQRWKFLHHNRLWGVHNEGTVFQITPAGVLATLHSFDGTDGNNPVGELFQATNGVFYGQTSIGGSGGDGTIFSLDVGLGPVVETAPISGKAGSKVIILGNKLKGTTSVTFNGATAVFKVVSSTEITTTVPTGAITGKVQVTTPGVTLTSNVNFVVP